MSKLIPIATLHQGDMIKEDEKIYIIVDKQGYFSDVRGVLTNTVKSITHDVGVELLNHPKYKLFIDDERWPSKPDSIIVRSVQQAIDAIEQYGMPEFISFDHDLGEGGESVEFVKWLKEKVLDNMLYFPKDFSYTIHSQNPIGEKNLRQDMENLLKYVFENNLTF